MKPTSPSGPEIQNLAVLPNNPKRGRVSELLADLDHWAGRLTTWFSGSWLSSPESCGTGAVQRQSARLEPSTSRIYVYHSWSWRWRKKATST